jgi:hypothetical protein
MKGNEVPTEMFQVVLRGRLSSTLLSAIDDFEVSRCEQGLTYLKGSVTDQAQLHNLFGLLRDLNIELVSVNAMDEALAD